MGTSPHESVLIAMVIDPKILDKNNLQKLEAVKNPKVMEVVEYFAKLCKPAKIIVITDDPKEIALVRQKALDTKEEAPLVMKGHTIHFDGINDLARDPKSTAVLVEGEAKMGKVINTKNRAEGLKEIEGYMDGAMKGKALIVRFFCLGPTNSRFSISALQLTDSWYVAHSEDLLYRAGYEQFKRLKGSTDFFSFLHSAGELENGVSKNVTKRRIYIDLKENRVLTVNNQYAGNSLGLKKLALRLGINKASIEGGWLAEHYFIMGVHALGKNRVTYVAGAYPSACGKTSTAMIPGQSIVGDDIAYLRPDAKKENVLGANIEQGIFGIIQDVNPVDDPVIYEVLTTPREQVFSNVLVVDGVPYWLGMGKEIPKKGINFSGEWFEGKKDADGKAIQPAHSNARYTLRLKELPNVDPRSDDPEGVPIKAIFYGGRDSDTSVPVVESLNWEHGVFIGGTVESETTSAIIGAQGVRRSDPMANLDFLVIPLGKYLENHRAFGASVKHPPKVFATNYFLKKEGKYLNSKVDKKVWVLWAEGRCYGDYVGVETPVGFIPKYADLKALFKSIFNKNYTEKDYEAQFTIRVTKYLEKMDRMEKMYKEEVVIPDFFWKVLADQRKRLNDAKAKFGAEEISPFKFA